MNGIELITAGRQRQIDGEGWTDKHDDEHRHGEMARAGALIAAEIDRLQRCKTKREAE